MIVFYGIFSIVCLICSIGSIHRFCTYNDDYFTSLMYAVCFFFGSIMFANATYNISVAHEEASRPCIEWVNPDGQLVTDSECLRNKP